jgi:hypothetical protein
LEGAIDVGESAPVTQRREFPFAADAILRKILERDDTETPRAYIAQCWKSVIILSGGAIEAQLLDKVQQEPKSATG